MASLQLQVRRFLPLWLLMIAGTAESRYTEPQPPTTLPCRMAKSAKRRECPILQEVPLSERLGCDADASYIGTPCQSPASSNGATCNFSKSNLTTDLIDATGPDVSESEYPGAPVDLQARYVYYAEKNERICMSGALDISWKPPLNNDSARRLSGFLLNVTYTSLDRNGSILRTFRINEQMANDRHVVFKHNCISISQQRSYDVQVFSLPRLDINSGSFARVSLQPSTHNHCQFRSYCYQPDVGAEQLDSSTVVVRFKSYPSSFGFTRYKLTLTAKGGETPPYIRLINTNSSEESLLHAEFTDVRRAVYDVGIQPQPRSGERRCCYKGSEPMEHCPAAGQLSINVLDWPSSTASSTGSQPTASTTTWPTSLTVDKPAAIGPPDGPSPTTDRHQTGVRIVAAPVEEDPASTRDIKTSFGADRLTAVVVSVSAAVVVLLALTLIGFRVQSCRRKRNGSLVEIQRVMEPGRGERAMLQPASKPRLMIVSAADDDDGRDIDIRCQQQQQRFRRAATYRVPDSVLSLLGKLMTMRCDCDVRFGRVVADNNNRMHTRNNNNNDVICNGDRKTDEQRAPDSGRVGPVAALLVVHSTTPTSSAVGRDALDWMTLLGPEVAADWIGPEAAVYHVYFPKWIVGCGAAADEHSFVPPADDLSVNFSVSTSMFNDCTQQLNELFDNELCVNQLPNVYKLMAGIEHLCAAICRQFQTNVVDIGSTSADVASSSSLEETGSDLTSERFDDGLSIELEIDEELRANDARAALAGVGPGVFRSYPTTGIGSCG